MRVMARRTTLALLMAALALTTTAARADWDPVDGHKMHFPQLPEAQGWSVNVHEPVILADDWQCSATGPVSDIHFWFSSRRPTFSLTDVYVRIRANDGAGAFDKPGALLWSADFSDPPVREDYGAGPQNWYGPAGPETVVADHSDFHQVNLTDIADPFTQQLGEVYWLELSVFGTGTMGPAEFGWKTSADHFQSTAVWKELGGDWGQLLDPSSGAALDLAFVITTDAPPPPIPEPAELGLIGLTTMALFRRSRRRRN
jgi:hypothetical protein